MILPDIDFVDTNAEATLDRIVQGYEVAAGRKLGEADPIMLFLKSIAYENVLLRNAIDFTGKQNLLFYAEGDYLDHLGFLLDIERNEAKNSLTTLRFTLASVQPSNIIIPLNTKVSDGNYTFQTTEVTQIVAGQLTVDVGAESVISGDETNNISIDRINQFIDVIPYVEKVSNLTDTSGGANTESDDSYKKRIALAPSSFSVAGPYESYKFWALTANQNIIDVAVVNKEERTQDIQYAGVVEVYPLIKSGQPATVEILGQVLEILSNKKVRPLTDKVETLAPIQVDYTIDLKYYIHTDDGANANIIQTKVSNAVQDFIKWQYEKLGRDINPSELTRLIVNAGAKRVDIISPIFTALDEFEIGNNISVNIVFDGFEQ